MIESLHGILIERHPTFAVIECGGVGYGVQISSRTGERLPQEGSELTMLTHLVVREDAMELFGFADSQEKEVFLNMISVNGVGPKTAQRILSGISPGDFLAIIAREDKTALGKIKGVGKKTAEQFILALKDKAIALSSVSGGEQTALLSPNQSEAVLALHTLGVKDPAAQKAVEKAVEILGVNASVTQIIPEALKHV
ncbi:MAG: Holliday junction branch migration protein RuvA [Hallerella porci]|uniref:Holliday junction branch migration complex subunit RuvA n=1 Tax=Hallerella porci TaxID=1945871 RepID=A0ABX5LP33_9BACT|nr:MULTISPECIES: Holliday junction branch migration protein RuvA [Hallerella]MCI5600427.1 Holliday junction branch migration protein RuvA [Hallerella sp.]MDY3922209.1 Holliday junction branch migration protein RuvA [Hallerella porci]PWL04174.1 Holliday junction DNA helicase subunit RuvA [Hallerella porci]